MSELHSVDPTTGAERAAADGTSEDKIPRAHVASELHKQLWSDLRVASFTLAVLYLVFALAHPRTVGGSAGQKLAIIAGASAAALLGCALWLRKSGRVELANVVAAGFAGIVLLNSAVHMVLAQDSAQSSNFIVLIVAIGTFFLSLPWCVAAIALVGAVWAVSLQMVGNNHHSHYAFAFLTSSLVAGLAFHFRTHALRRSIVDSWKESRYRDRLEAADAELVLANTELERRVDERTAALREQIEQTRLMEEAALEAEKLAATGRMAATIAHEINNPLGALSNIVYLINDSKDDAERVGSLAAMAQEQVQRLAHITRQTLSFYRESGRPAVTDVGALMSEIIALYKHVAAKNGVTVQLVNEGEARVECYAGEIRQVLSNLLLNSVEASGQGDRVMVRIRSTQSQASGTLISFCDQGRGIPREFRQRVFKPFFTTKERTGTGLGLWVALGIVTRHGGKIRLRSTTRPDRHGTVMSVWLPKEAAPEIAARRRYEKLDTPV